jgi:hypothetical protein
MKNILRIAFFCPKGTFENLNLCYFPENCFHFWKLYMIYAENFLVYPENLFSYLGKNMIFAENFFWHVRKIFLSSPPPPLPPPVANFSGENILDALLYSDSAPQSLASQLLEASYAPVPTAVCGYKGNQISVYLLAMTVCGYRGYQTSVYLLAMHGSQWV